MEIWKYGNKEIWKYGNIEIWIYGNMKIGKYGSMEIWKFIKACLTIYADMLKLLLAYLHFV